MNMMTKNQSMVLPFREQNLLAFLSSEEKKVHIKIMQLSFFNSMIKKTEYALIDLKIGLLNLQENTIVVKQDHFAPKFYTKNKFDYNDHEVVLFIGRKDPL